MCAPMSKGVLHPSRSRTVGRVTTWIERTEVYLSHRYKRVVTEIIAMKYLRYLDG